jgi:hypothetical protein
LLFRAPAGFTTFVPNPARDTMIPAGSVPILTAGRNCAIICSVQIVMLDDESDVKNAGNEKELI